MSMTSWRDQPRLNAKDDLQTAPKHATLETSQLASTDLMNDLDYVFVFEKLTDAVAQHTVHIPRSH